LGCRAMLTSLERAGLGTNHRRACGPVLHISATCTTSLIFAPRTLAFALRDEHHDALRSILQRRRVHFRVERSRSEMGAGIESNRRNARGGTGWLSMGVVYQASCVYSHDDALRSGYRAPRALGNTAIRWCSPTHTAMRTSTRSGNAAGGKIRLRGNVSE
jgi:hypothetical protein